MQTPAVNLHIDASGRFAELVYTLNAVAHPDAITIASGQRHCPPGLC